ncbi:hypothetical protein CDL15_Pgr003158 [Punica granatum]|uniref:AB hydrolase-1 domain-containing protein n=1 Tax=Punica granatum TaxID=22663 RepID=A0A218X1X2_PUNGR|nr:hypothetical protein CDL15_Pgr003158 [Punica granatum]
MATSLVSFYHSGQWQPQQTRSAGVGGVVVGMAGIRSRSYGNTLIYGFNSIVQALNAKVYGNGTQTLVLSHGLGTDQIAWHFLIPHLTCFFKVVIYDLASSPNAEPKLYNATTYSNFDSYASDLLCLMDEMNVSKAVFMGQSMSAMIVFGRGRGKRRKKPKTKMKKQRPWRCARN